MGFSTLALAPIAVASALARPGGGDHFVERMLAAHNQPRAELGLAPLAWNDDLAADAAIWARTLSRESRFQHEVQKGEGENLWMGTAGHFSYEQMIGSWSGERRIYRHGPFPQVSATGNWHDVGTTPRWCGARPRTWGARWRTTGGGIIWCAGIRRRGIGRGSSRIEGEGSRGLVRDVRKVHIKGIFRCRTPGQSTMLAIC